MPMRMIATPAKFTPTGYEVELLDPKRIERDVTPENLAAAKAEFATFIGTVPAGSWMVSALWIGRDKAPRGFKVARERDEFQHAIRPQAIAA